MKQLGGLFVTGSDVGTTSAGMDIIGETGAPDVFGRTPAVGGSGDSRPPTAVGLLAGIRATLARRFGSEALSGRRVLVQGAGSVGGHLIELLRAGGNLTLLGMIRVSRRCRPERECAQSRQDAGGTVDRHGEAGLLSEHHTACRTMMPDDDLED